MVKKNELKEYRLDFIPYNKFSYFKYNYKNNYNNIKKELVKITDAKGYEKLENIENEFNYNIEIYQKVINEEIRYYDIDSLDKRDNLGNLFRKQYYKYIVYIEADEISESFYQLLIEYYLEKIIPYEYYLIYVIFNVKKFDSNMEHFIRYGMNLPIIIKGKMGAKNSIRYNVFPDLLPIAINTKENLLYAGTRSIVNDNNYKELKEPFFDCMKEYYKSNKISLEENYNVENKIVINAKNKRYYITDNIYHKFSCHFYNTNSSVIKDKKISIVNGLIYNYIYLIIFCFLAIFPLTIFGLSKASIIMLAFFLIIMLIMIVNYNRNLYRNLIKIEKIKLEKDSPIVKYFETIFEKSNHFSQKYKFPTFKDKCLKILFGENKYKRQYKYFKFYYIDNLKFDYTLFANSNILLFKKDFYLTNKNRLDKMIKESTKLAFIYDSNIKYIDVVKNKANLIILKKFLKLLDEIL